MFKSKNNMTEVPSKGFKRSLLAVSIMALGMPAFAQTAQTENLEEVVVTGMRTSINNAQEIKRAADTVKDVITAADIGALPDKSVTEALQRVPGVTIERFASSSDPKHYADEGTGVLVRGLDRVRSEVNGRDAFSANPWGGLSYEDFPAELLGAVEVVKNQTADLIAGGIAGTINLMTRKPFDSDEQVISVNAKANYGDFREEVTPSFSALFSDSWDTSAGRFGVLIAGSQSKYETRGDGVGVGNFHARGIDNTPNASWDIWGTPTGPGAVKGDYDGPCVPNALGWMPECNGVPANIVSAEDAYTSPYDGPGLAGQPEGTTWYAPAQYHISTAENDRERTGFTTSLQWENNDETIVATLEHINSNASLEWRERQVGQGAQGFQPYMGRSQHWEGDAENGRPLTIDENGFVTSGIGLGVNPDVPLNYRTRWNYNENTVEDTSLNFVLKPTDRLTVELDYQHIDSEKIVHNYSMAAQTRGAVVQEVMPYYIDMRGSRPTIEFLNEDVMTPGWVSATEPAVFMGTGMEQEEFNTARADSFKVDFTYELDGVFTAVKGGAYYSDKDLTVRDTAYEGWSAIGTPWNDADRVAAAAATNPDLFERVDLSDFYNGKVLKGNVNNFLFPKVDLVKNYAESFRQGCKDGWNGSEGMTPATPGACVSYLPYEDMPNRIEGPFAAHNISKSNEKRSELYVRGDFAFDDLAIPVKGNVGLRYVGYELESTGYLVLPKETSRGTESGKAVLARDYKSIYDLATGTATQSTVSGTDYNTVLPSLNLTFGVSDDVLVRMGVSKGLYFPKLVDTTNTMVLGLDYVKRLQDPTVNENVNTNPVIAIDSVSLSASGGNPYLEPEEAINFDLTTEWYFAQAGSVTVGLFHKELDKIIRNKQFNLDVEHMGTTHPVSAYGPANTGSGTIRGAEFSYSQFYDFLPGALSGLGLQFNYTYIDQNGLEDPNGAVSSRQQFNTAGDPVVDNRNTFRVFSNQPLEGYSDQNMNIVGMYEYNDISFRLAYTWRSEYLLTLRESEDFTPVYADASGMVDASLYYSINENWKVGIEGSNLLNKDTKTKYQLNDAGVKTDALRFTTDRRYALSVRATF
jgi:iron complex outermembrane receptor protein